MYVEDMDLEDAKATLAEVKASPCRDCEQCRWDIEDLEGRIEDLQFVAEYKRQINSAKQR